MKSVTISMVSLRVKKRKDGEYIELIKLPNRHTLLSLLEQFLEELTSHTPREDNNHVLLTASHIKKTPHSISACLERGEYGITSSLLNVKKKIVYHKRSVDEAEMMPFFFLAAIPVDGKMGVAAFQMESNAGVRSRFKLDFEDFLREKCGKNVDLEIENIVPKRLIRDYVRKERVSKLRFVGLKAPRSIAKAFQGDNFGKNTTIALQVKVKHGAKLLMADSIREVMNGHKPVNEFVQIRGFNLDTLKAEFDVHGRQRTLNFTNKNNFHAEYDVTKNIKGYPTFTTIYPAARELVIEIMESLKLDTDGV